MSEADIPRKHMYEIKVRSLSSTPVSDLVAQIKSLSGTMAVDLDDENIGLQITVERQEPIPLDPITVILLVGVANLTFKPFLEGFFKKLGERMAEYLTDGVDNAQISVEEKPSVEPRKHGEEPETPARNVGSQAPDQPKSE